MTKVRLILLVAVLALFAIAGCRSAHTTSAILYIEEQNYDKAVAVIQEGFAFQDDEPDAYYYLGEAYSHLAEVAIEKNDYLVAKQNYELAYDNYRHSMEIDPENFTEAAVIAMQHNFTLRNNDAKLEFSSGYYEEAEGYFRLAFAALPDSLSPIKDIARMKMQHSSEVEELEQQNALLEEALELLNQVLDANPDVYGLQADKANVLKYLGRTTEADIIFKRLLAEHGDDTQLLRDIAELAMDEGDLERAADLYVQIANIYENDTDARNDEGIKPLLLGAGTWLGRSSIGRYEEALQLLDRAAEREIFGAQEATLLVRLQTNYNYGRHLKSQADAETDPVRKTETEQNATQVFQRGVDIGNALTIQYPGSAEGFFFLSQCQFELGEYTAGELNFKAYEELQGTEDTP